MDADYHRQKGKEHYNKYKQQYLDRHKVVRERNYSIMNEARLGGCVVCGERDKVCLDFHHIGSNKDKSVSSMVNYSEQRIRAEIAKCVVLCANCHRKVHAGVINLALG